MSVTTINNSTHLTFDRSGDVSKLEGCNTRGIKYRWSIFLNALARIPVGSEVLDFGAGSLRESFDLINRGFNVTSVDMDKDILESYRMKYSWPKNGAKHNIIASGELLESLQKLDRKFALVVCFDVLEHLKDPINALQAIGNKMDDGGLLLVSVPNGRTIFELAWRFDLIIARWTNRYIRPGEPHLQRNSPRQWKKIISEAGLKIIDHDMEIGFFANTFAAFVKLPLAFCGRLLRMVGIQVNAIGLSEKICSGPQANVLSFMDRQTKSLLCGLYGWNLFVISK